MGNGNMYRDDNQFSSVLRDDSREARAYQFSGAHYRVPATENWITVENHRDMSGKVLGGVARGVGFNIEWQNGGMDRSGGDLPNGAFVEDLIQVVIDRLTNYQASPFSCEENQDALASLRKAYDHLTMRRERRFQQGVLGKDEVHVSSPNTQ